MTVFSFLIDTTFARVKRKPFNNKTRDKTSQVDKSFITRSDNLHARSLQLHKNVQAIS